MANTEINTKIEANNNSLQSIKDLLKSWNIWDALKVLWWKIEAWIEDTKIFLQDLFKIRETTKNLSEEDTKNLYWILDKLLLYK